MHVQPVSLNGGLQKYQGRGQRETWQSTRHVNHTEIFWANRLCSHNTLQELVSVSGECACSSRSRCRFQYLHPRAAILMES